MRPTRSLWIPLMVFACSGARGDALETETATATDGASTTSGSVSASSTSVTATATETASTATTTSSETTTTGETTTTDDPCACNFLCAGVLCDFPSSSVECDVWSQDCPRGEKCSAWANDGGASWNATKCAPIDADPDPVGEPCTVVGSGTSGVDSCAKGAMCWDVDPETLTGECVALCVGDEASCEREPTSCCAPGDACVIANDGVLNLCLPMCNPLLQDCPFSFEICLWYDDAFWCAPEAQSSGNIGDPCEFVIACEPGLYCGDPTLLPGCDLDASGCCIPYCDLGEPDCPPETECVPWYPPMDVPPGFEDLGSCQIPG